MATDAFGRSAADFHDNTPFRWPLVTDNAIAWSYFAEQQQASDLLRVKATLNRKRRKQR